TRLSFIVWKRAAAQACLLSSLARATRWVLPVARLRFSSAALRPGEMVWLHRLLTARGVINHVVEPTSILVTRGARRAKTDRPDAVGLLRVLAAKFAGDPGACRTVVVPSGE